MPARLGTANTGAVIACAGAGAAIVARAIVAHADFRAAVGNAAAAPDAVVVVIAVIPLDQMAGRERERSALIVNPAAESVRQIAVDRPVHRERPEEKGNPAAVCVRRIAADGPVHRGRAARARHVVVRRRQRADGRRSRPAVGVVRHRVRAVYPGLPAVLQTPVCAGGSTHCTAPGQDCRTGAENRLAGVRSIGQRNRVCRLNARYSGDCRRVAPVRFDYVRGGSARRASCYRHPTSVVTRLTGFQTLSGVFCDTNHLGCLFLLCQLMHHVLMKMKKIIRSSPATPPPAPPQQGRGVLPPLLRRGGRG